MRKERGKGNCNADGDDVKLAGGAALSRGGAGDLARRSRERSQYCRYAAAGGRLGLLSVPGPDQPIPSAVSGAGRARVTSSSLLTPPRFDTFHHPPEASWSSRYLIGIWHGDVRRDITSLTLS
ncbi:hypothetical protein O3P69_006538 [Scylla paramamosain]|uniref:Uncharacterized protein n=1 Tax=Scylla paramamosain TaxID=85552 RepID=A0AAW0U2X3_SCYPA